MNLPHIKDRTQQILKDKLVTHRDDFKSMMGARYKELLPSLINYKNAHTVRVDFMKVEIALRNGYDVVIGDTVDGTIQVIGWVTSLNSESDPSRLFAENRLTHADIHFTIPKYRQLKYYREILHADGCKSGNFVVLRNKNIKYVSDNQIIQFYIDELAEIVLSRFSLSMQVKISTLFLGEVNDESLNQLITDIYNGNPYVSGSKLFDPHDQIYHFKNENVASNFQELKREYQNKISELNNMLGIHSLAVEKSSGVSDEEANSNRAFTTSNANINLDARNNGLLKLNKRYGLSLEAQYNDEVVSEFETLAQREAENDGGESFDNTL